jgi:hypothetical protein
MFIKFNVSLSRTTVFSPGIGLLSGHPKLTAPPNSAGISRISRIVGLMGRGAVLSAPNGAPSFPDSSPAPLMAPQKRCQEWVVFRKVPEYVWINERVARNRRRT